MAQAPPKAGARELWYSLNLIHEFTYLFSLKVICAGSLRKGFPQKHAFVDISAFLWLRKQQPRFAQGQPTGYYQMKELDRTTEAIVRMNEMWRRLHTNMHQCVLYVPAWANIAVCQLCRERQPLWNSHDGPNLTCLDQCHGVRSSGIYSSQGWRKRIAVQSKFDP